MSLSRAEHTVHDHITRQPDELRHWRDKVVHLAAATPDPHAAADAVADALVDYCRERAGVVAEFRAPDGPGGNPGRLKLRSLAELLVRQWVPPKPRPPTAARGES